MKVKKLIAKAEAIFNSDERGRKEKATYVKKVLKKLRSYEEELSVKLQKETDQPAIDKLKRKISLVHAQRKKGLTQIKSLNKHSKSDS